MHSLSIMDKILNKYTYKIYFLKPFSGMTLVYVQCKESIATIFNKNHKFEHLQSARPFTVSVAKSIKISLILYSSCP